MVPHANNQDASDARLTPDSVVSPGMPRGGQTTRVSTGVVTDLSITDLEHVVLNLLAVNGGSLGSSSLLDQLLELGYRGSEPTVGRFLRALDRRGLTVRVSNRGRTLTEAGRQRLADLSDIETQRRCEHQLLGTIRTTTIADLLDVLVARRALEREAARLAAEHATDEDISHMEAALAGQRRALAADLSGVHEDVEFHMLVARAGRNRVLVAAIDLIRRNIRLALRLDAILKQTDHAWVVDHDRILAAIKRRAPEGAERAMLDHINTLIADIQAYHDHVVLAAEPAASENRVAVTRQIIERRH